MSKMVQVRNVPDALHRKLKARAAVAGQSLSDYLLAELERIGARPTREKMLARIHARTPRSTADTSGGRHSQRARIRVIVVDASALTEFLLQTPLGATSDSSQDEAVADRAMQARRASQ